MASNGSEIFRKVSLERLSSPEQLDQLIQVTRPRGWLALAAIWCLILVTIAWGVLGSVPTSANGTGILIRQGGVSAVVVNGSGPVEEILVEVGDRIEKGDVVARIRQESIERQIADVQVRLDSQKGDYQELQRYAEEQRRLSRANEAQQRSNLERSTATLEYQIELLEKNLRVEKELLVDGLVTQQNVLQREQEVNRSRDELEALRLELAGLELERLETEQQLERQLEGYRNDLRDLELELADKNASLEETSRVRAAASGRVLELVAAEGDVVQPGTALLNLEVDADELIAVLFVPADLGKQIQPGMDARVTPSTVKREEHGFILGRVTWVSEFPATARGMQRQLANQRLVDRLLESGPPIQVNVELERNEQTRTGFSWSSSAGPNLDITSGTLASGSVIVREDRPITLVVPKLRESLGI